MSFYGSIYYQAGEALTKVFIQNFGKNKTDFLTENLEDEVEIKADGRKGSLYLNNGNRWLSLKGDAENNLCTIYHNAPDETNLSQYLVPITKTEQPPTGTQIVELPLSDDVYFSTPAIYYDEAGHVIPTGNVMYFKIPKIAIQQGIDDLTARITTVEETVNKDHEDRIGKMEQKADGLDTSLKGLSQVVGYKSDMTDNNELTITGAIGDMDTFRQTISDNEATLTGKLSEIYLAYNAMNESYRNLDTDIRDIKARLDAAGL